MGKISGATTKLCCLFAAQLAMVTVEVTERQARRRGDNACSSAQTLRFGTQGSRPSFATPGGPQSAEGFGANALASAGGSGNGLPGPAGSILGGSNSSIPTPTGNAPFGVGDNSQSQFAQVQNISGATTPSSGGTDSGSGVPVDITDPTTIASKAGASVQQGAQQLGTKIQGTGKALDQSIQATGQALDTTATQNTQSAETTGTGWLQYLGNTVYDVAIRATVGAAALILLLIGLWMIGKQQATPRPGGS